MKGKLTKLMVNNSFWVNTFHLIFGTVLSQVIPILLQPFLRRWFSPEEFGAMAIYFSIVSIFCVLVNLNYQSAVVLPDEEEDAMSIVIGSISISAINSVLLGLLFLVFSDWIIQKWKLDFSFKTWFWFLPLSIFLNSSHLIFSNWLIRKKKFKALSLNKVSRRSTEGLFQMTGGLFSWKWGLNGGVIFGDFFNFITYCYQYFRTGGKLNKTIFNNVKSVFVRYKEFPMVGFIPNLLTTISSYIPVFLVSYHYDVELTGQLDLSRQILALPLALIAASISQVILQEFTELRRSEAHFNVRFKQLFLILLGISILMCIIVSLFGRALFVFIFGENWSLSGEITEVLVWSYAIKLIVAPLSMIFIVLEKLKLNAAWQVSNFLIISTLFFVGKKEFSDFMNYLVAIDMIMYFIYGFLIVKTVIKYDKKLDIN